MLRPLFKTYCKALDTLIATKGTTPPSPNQPIFKNVLSAVGDLDITTHLRTIEEKNGSAEELALSTAVIAMLDHMRGILHNAGVPGHKDMEAMAAVNGRFDDPIFRKWEPTGPNGEMQAVGPISRRTHCRSQAEDNEGGGTALTAEVDDHSDHLSTDTAVFVLGSGDESSAASGGMWTISLLERDYMVQDTQQFHPTGTVTAADTARRDHIAQKHHYPLAPGLHMPPFTGKENCGAVHAWSPRREQLLLGKKTRRC